MTPTRIMLIAGETSGDMLAAQLITEMRAGIAQRNTYSTDVQPLRADLAPQFFGAGGPRMAEAGMELVVDMTRYSVVGVWEVILMLLEFRRVFNRLLALARERKPHIIVCVDYSGFNRQFAAAIKKYVRSRRGTFNNWEPLIVQYVSPQLWASRESRVWQVARDFDLLLSIFPFETEWYAKRVPKFRVEFVGNPILDRHEKARRELARPESEMNGIPSAPNIVLLPGSRRAELERHLPVLLETFQAIHAVMPAARGTVVLPNENMAGLARICARALSPNAPVNFLIDDLPQVLSNADLAISKTGTVSMECAYFGVPTVTLYKTSRTTYQLGKRIMKVNSLTMANLLAKEPVFPEFIQHAATPDNLFRAAIELLRDPVRRTQMRAKLAQIIATLGGPGASKRAADAILKLAIEDRILA